MTKRLFCLIVICICIAFWGCSYGSKSEVTGDNTPAVSAKSDINNDPTINYSEDFSKVIFVLTDSPALYEEEAVTELRLFFGQRFEITEQTHISQYSVQNDALTVYLKTDSSLNGYSILSGDNNINIVGSSSDMVYLASMRLIYDCFNLDPSQINSANIAALKISEKSVEREEYIRDISLFTPVWQYQWTPPAWMLDFSEKQNSFTVSGRMMCTAHRGGLQFYPENSIESVISSIKMGCDIIEIDVQRTKDDMLVLMHGDLNECTDWAEKKGKNGLPKSQKVVGWTYEQLTELNLRFNYGQYSSETGEITPYKIPTLKEVMSVCKNRIFVNLDKIDCIKYWDEIYSVLKETESTQNFLFGKSFKDSETDLEPYRSQMASDGFPVSLNYYSRKHTGDLSKDITLKTQTELNAFFSQYNKPGNNFLTDHPFECVQWISDKK